MSAAEIKTELLAEGFEFFSQTDTEVFTQLIERERKLLIQKAQVQFEEMSDLAPEIILLDLPAASGDGTRSIFEQFALLETAQELGYRITLGTNKKIKYQPVNKA